MSIVTVTLIGGMGLDPLIPSKYLSLMNTMKFDGHGNGDLLIRCCAYFTSYISKYLFSANIS